MAQEIVLPRDVVTLETPRLRLRAFRLEDADDIFAYARQPDVSRFTTWDAHASVADSRAFVQRVIADYDAGNTGTWAIELRSTGRVIGSIGMHTTALHHFAEVGYALGKDHWGRGLVTEALRAVLDFGFDHVGLHRMFVRCEPENVGSWRVAQKAGLRFEGIVRGGIYAKARHRDLMWWGAVRDDPRPKQKGRLPPPLISSS